MNSTQTYFGVHTYRPSCPPHALLTPSPPIPSPHPKTKKACGRENQRQPAAQQPATDALRIHSGDAAKKCAGTHQGLPRRALAARSGECGRRGNRGSALVSYFGASYNTMDVGCPAEGVYEQCSAGSGGTVIVESWSATSRRIPGLFVRLLRKCDEDRCQTSAPAFTTTTIIANLHHPSGTTENLSQVEKQQNERQRKFSHSRGVAPATQLDYPLFGNGAGGGPRRRPLRGRPEALPPPGPPAPAAVGTPKEEDEEDNKGHGKSSRTAAGGRKFPPAAAVAGAAASAMSALPFPSGRGVARTSGGPASGEIGAGSGAEGSGGQGGPSSWPQKPGPPPWPPEASSNNGYVNGAVGAPGGGGGAGGLAYNAGAAVVPRGGASGVGGARAGPFSGTNGSVRPDGGGSTFGRGYGAAPPGVSSPPVEAFRGGGGGAHGLRKRPGARIIGFGACSLEGGGRGGGRGDGISGCPPLGHFLVSPC